MKSPELNYPLPENNDLDKSKESLYMEYGELSPEEQEKMKIVNEQFENPQFVEIPIPGNENEKIKVEYIVLDARDEKKFNNDKTILNVAGFGASYRGQEPFIKLLAVRENKRVINISMPNTGKSDTMPVEFRKWSEEGRSFEQFVEVLNTSFEVIKDKEPKEEKKTTDEISLVGVSKGALVATEMAVKYPDKVKDLVLIHPSGVNNEEGFWSLTKRQALETMSDKKALNKNPEIKLEHKKELEEAYQEMFGKSLQEAYEEAGGEGKFDLQDADTQAHNFHNQSADNINKDGRANIMNNFLWHVWEVTTLAKGGTLEMLPKVKANTYIIYGGDDKLFPPSQVEKIKEKMPNIDIKVFAGMNHNGPYQNSRRYSASVGTFLGKMREEGK